MLARVDMETSQHYPKCVEQARRAWLEGDGPAFVSLFTADGLFSVPGQKWQGSTAILDAFQSFMATHAVREITIRNLVQQDDLLMLEWTWVEVERQTGKVSRADDAIAIDLAGAKVQRWREYIDTASPQSDSA